jgi:hypothetical protein
MGFNSAFKGLTETSFLYFSKHVDLLVQLLVLCHKSHSLSLKVKWPMKGAGRAENESDS